MTPDNMQPIQQGTPTTWLLDYVANKGLSLDNICAELNIDKGLFSKNRGAVSPTVLNQLFECCARKLENQNFGLEMAQALKSSELGLINYLVNNEKTLKESLTSFEHYLCVFDPENTFSTEFSPKVGRIYYQGAHIPSMGSIRQDIDFSIAVAFRLIKDRSATDQLPCKVSFTYPEPKDTAEHLQLFGTDVKFNQAKNYIEFPADILEQPIEGADHELLNILKVHANALIEQLNNKQTITDKVKLLITTHIGDSSLSTELVAARLHMSVRNLYRQLADNDTSFQLLRDDVLLTLAKQALTDSNSNITDIALELGYSEPSSFVRVFKRLTGLTPLQFRKQTKL